MVPWMNDKRTTARAFHDAAGVEDWRVLFPGPLVEPASPENHGVDIAAWPDFEDGDG
jgi:hypothetical protein